jgi:hypothetical protein
MKKFILSILATLYIFSTTGASLQMHYCMGRLADWSIGRDNSSICGRCGMEKVGNSQDNGCCNDEETFVKNTIDQKPGNFFTFHAQAPACTETGFPAPPSFVCPTKAITESPDLPLPRSSAVSRYILISVFRL